MPNLKVIYTDKGKMSIVWNEDPPLVNDDARIITTVWQSEVVQRNHSSLARE
jgi:hypothetical protein